MRARNGAVEEQEKGRRLKFVTLTMPASLSVPSCWTLAGSNHVGHRCTPALARCPLVTVPSLGPVGYRYAAWAWNRLRTMLLERWGAFAYFRAVEETKRGTPHYHLLVSTRAFWAQRTLSDMAAAAGFGPVTWVRAVHSAGGAARYCVKYATKNAGLGVVPERMRFFTTSKGWGQESNVEYIVARAERAAASGWTWAYVKERDIDAVVTALESFDTGPPCDSPPADERMPARAASDTHQDGGAPRSVEASARAAGAWD